MPDLPPDSAAKTRFVAELAAATGLPLPFVRQRVRAMFIGGIGPRRNAPMDFPNMADFIVGLISSPSHLEAADITRRFGAFRLVGIDPPNSRPAEIVDAALRPREAPLRDVLAGLIASRTEDSTGLHVLELSASWPPHDAFTIRLLTGAGARPVGLTFADKTAAAKALDAPGGPPWPLRHQVTLSGHVLDAVAWLALPSLTQPEGPAASC